MEENINPEQNVQQEQPAIEEKKKSFPIIPAVITVVVVFMLIGVVGYYISQNKSLTPLDVASASVEVVSPDDGEEWVVGTKQIIKWDSSNIPKKARIGIQLANSNLDEDGFWEGIANDLPNSGEHTWKIPDVIKNGKYKVYIYTQGIGEKLDVSDDALVYISGSISKSPKIDNISPTSGSLPPAVVTEIVNENEVKEIVISGSGFVTEEDDFGKNKIYFSSGDSYALFGRLSPDGKMLTIYLRSFLEAGENVVPGEYEIFVENARGKSNVVVFTVEEPTTPSISVIQPKGGEVWRIGSTYDIQWIGKNIPADGFRKINIELQSGVPYEETGSSKFFKSEVIFNDIINDGSESWTIPSNSTPGDYKILIKCSPPYWNECPGGDDNDLFQIVGE